MKQTGHSGRAADRPGHEEWNGKKQATYDNTREEGSRESGRSKSADDDKRNSDHKADDLGLRINTNAVRGIILWFLGENFPLRNEADVAYFLVDLWRTPELLWKHLLGLSPCLIYLVRLFLRFSLLLLCVVSLRVAGGLRLRSLFFWFHRYNHITRHVFDNLFKCLNISEDPIKQSGGPRDWRGPRIDCYATLRFLFVAMYELKFFEMQELT